MSFETYLIEFTLEPMPLPPEREAEYWAAMRLVVELVREAQSLDGGGLRSED